MSENGEKPSYGIRPRGVRPTVIGVGSTTNILEQAPQGAKPTMIGGGPAPSHPITPTRIGGEHLKAETPQGVKPTAISPTSLPSAPPPSDKPIVLSAPSAIPGTVRRGIEVSIEELSKFFPGTPVETLKKAQEILKRTVLELLTDAQCALWGAETQKRFGDLTERSLQITSANVVQETSRHLSRLYAILQELGEAFQGKGSGLMFWKKENPWEQFQEVSTEIRQLRQLLNQQLPAIIKSETETMSLSGEFEILSLDIDAEGLAGRYLAEKLLKDKDRASQTLMDRSLSLTETVAHIQQGTLLREQAANNIRQLVSRIQDGVLRALPAWIESITLTYQTANQTETDIYTLRQGLEGIIQKLKN
jgi:hypothetical protein